MGQLWLSTWPGAASHSAAPLQTALPSKKAIGEYPCIMFIGYMS